MATISNTPRPGYIYDTTDGVWYPIGTGAHSHNEIAKTIVDAKGDLIAGTANDTVNRLAVGTDGQVLVADSTQATGLGWTGQPYQNPVLNSAFQVWQRGTSFSQSANTSAYTADRWYFQSGTSACTVSRQTTSDTTNLPNIQYCIRMQRNSGQTGTGSATLSQSFETINSIPYAGKTITLSFYARKGANWSPSTLEADIYWGTGTDQNGAGGYTGVNAFGNNFSLTTTWARYTLTGTLPTTATEIMPYFYWVPTGTAGANDYYEITGVQIDLGSVALPFRTYASNLQGELAACQRYLPAITASSASDGAIGYHYNTTSTIAVFVLPTQARVNPTGITTTGQFLAQTPAAGNQNVTLNFNGGGSNFISVYSTGLTASTAGYAMRYQFPANGVILCTGCEL